MLLGAISGLGPRRKHQVYGLGEEEAEEGSKGSSQFLNPQGCAHLHPISLHEQEMDDGLSRASCTRGRRDEEFLVLEARPWQGRKPQGRVEAPPQTSFCSSDTTDCRALFCTPETNKRKLQPNMGEDLLEARLRPAALVYSLLLWP